MLATAFVALAVLLFVLLALAPVMARSVPADVVAVPGAGRGRAARTQTLGTTAQTAALTTGGTHDLAPLTPIGHRADIHDLAA